jgi:type IX secretion system PorP/SprF family membrane protein
MKYILTYLVVFGALSVWGQDPNFSQFYNNPIYYNPAMTAINSGTCLRFNGRNQWGPVPGKFNTVSMSVDAQTAYKMGLGFYAFSNNEGGAALRTNAGYFTYSYRAVDAKNLIIQAGVSAGLVNKNIDFSKLVFSDQLDETQGSIYNTGFVAPNRNYVYYADVNAGLVVRFNGKRKRTGRPFKQFSGTVGSSVSHLSRPKDALLTGEQFLPMKFIGHTHFGFMFNKVIFQPSAVYELQSNFQTFSLGMNFVHRPYSFGVWFRNQTYLLTGNNFDSFILSVGLNPKTGPNGVAWRLVYNYDVTISKLRSSSFGTHEISLAFDFDHIMFAEKARRRDAMRLYQCPDGFSGYQ